MVVRARQSRPLHTALARSVVLPRLLDTLSTTFQQSSSRMDGLISNMTQELDKVGGLCQLSSWVGAVDTASLHHPTGQPWPGVSTAHQPEQQVAKQQVAKQASKGALGLT